jgi:hypothetical protein
MKPVYAYPKIAQGGYFTYHKVVILPTLKEGDYIIKYILTPFFSILLPPLFSFSLSPFQ